jgi:hypothetical protein
LAPERPVLAGKLQVFEVVVVIEDLTGLLIFAVTRQD